MLLSRPFWTTVIACSPALILELSCQISNSGADIKSSSWSGSTPHSGAALLYAPSMLRSRDQNLLMVPHTRFKTSRDCSSINLFSLLFGSHDEMFKFFPQPRIWFVHIKAES